VILKFFESAECGLEYLARFLAAISALAAASITCIICLSVIMRRLVNSPLFYAEELVGLLLAVTLFFALPLVTMRGEHIRVTLLAAQLSQRGKTYLGFIGGLVGLTFLGWLIWESVEWMSFAIRLNLKTEATSIPLVPWMAVVPFSLCITALGIFIQLCTALARLKNDEPSSTQGPQSSFESSKDKTS
jgi:TRAP-type C4-dicarboxylate transport system permease small subunit